MKDKKENKKSTRTSKMPGAVSETGSDLGVIQIHESVLSSIVRKATCAVDGVTRLAGNTIVDNIAEFVGSKKMHDRAISVAIDGASVSVEVSVNMLYDVHVPSVAAEIQSSVIDMVEKITGMTVSNVNVIVMELDSAPEEEEEAEENEG